MSSQNMRYICTGFSYISDRNRCKSDEDVIENGEIHLLFCEDVVFLIGGGRYFEVGGGGKEVPLKKWNISRKLLDFKF